MNMNTSMMQLLGATPNTGNQGYTKDTKNKSVSKTNFEDTMQDRQNVNARDSKNKDTKVDKETKGTLKKNVSVIDKKMEKKSMEESLTPEVVKGKLSNEIMAILAQALQMDPKIIETKLEELGYIPLEVMDLDVFKNVIKELIGEEAFNVLGDASLIRNVSKLWDELNQSIAQMTEEMSIPLDEIMKTTSSQGDIKETMTAKQNDVVQETSEQQVENNTPMLKVHKNENKDASGNEGQIITSKFQPIGMHIPVQNILESQTTRLWEQMTKETVGMRHTEHAPIHKQILSKVDVIALKDGNEMTLELAPKELGKLSLKVSEHNGIVQTTIRVENEKTKEVLMQNLEVLKESLEKKGLEVGAFQVDVRQNTHQEEMQKQKNKSSKRIQEIIESQLAGIEEEMLEEQVHISTEIDVDMKA